MVGSMWPHWSSQEATAICDSEPGQWQCVHVPVWATLDIGQEPRVALTFGKVGGQW